LYLQYQNTDCCIEELAKPEQESRGEEEEEEEED
jgi:hypothetical protein